jgi:hypothetical protein
MISKKKLLTLHVIVWGIAQIADFGCDYHIFSVSEYFLFIFISGLMKLLLYHSKQSQELYFKVAVIGTMTQRPGKVLAFLFIDI